MARREAAALTEEIRELRVELAGLRIEREAAQRELSLVGDIAGLQEKISALKIDQGRIDEKHAREKREVEHATGLMRQQAEWDTKKAVEEATLKVREENLGADQKRFTDQMEFHKDQIKSEVDRLVSLSGSLLERLPVVNVAIEKS